MEAKIILESFFNAIDIGTVFEAITKYRRRSWKVNHKEIIKYMITGKGYTNLTPPQTSRLLLEGKNNVQIFDLRDTESYRKNHINGSISKPIDDFLKEIFQGIYSSKKKDSQIVLVCDTGQLSKVAAAILVEEGFAHVYSIKGGMRRWNRWMKLSNNSVIRSIPSCCPQIH